MDPSRTATARVEWRRLVRSVGVSRPWSAGVAALNMEARSPPEVRCRRDSTSTASALAQAAVVVSTRIQPGTSKGRSVWMSWNSRSEK